MDTSERQRKGNKAGKGESYLSEDLEQMVRQQQKGQGILLQEWRCTSRARQSKGQTEPAPRPAAPAARMGQGGGASPALLLGKGEKEHQGWERRDMRAPGLGQAALKAETQAVRQPL